MAVTTVSAEQVAAELGQELRQARLRLGLSVDAVSAGLRVRQGYVEALENGAWSEFPTQMHAKGFARSYAMMLGLDPAVYAAVPSADEAPARAGVGIIRAAGRVQRKAPPTLAAIACGLAAYLFVTLSEPGGALDAGVPEVPAELAIRADVVLAQGSFQAVAGTIPPRVATAEVAQVGRLPNPEPSQPVQPQAAAASPGELATNPIMSRKVELQIVSDSPDGVWVRVRHAQSREVLIARVLRPGEIWRVPPRQGLLLDVGRAHEIRVLVDGSPVPARTDMRGVRRGVAVEDLLPSDLQGTAQVARPVVYSAMQVNR